MTRLIEFQLVKYVQQQQQLYTETAKYQVLHLIVY